jgi:hypothetical protein
MWLATDPQLVDEPGDAVNSPVMLAAYTYTELNPLRLVDPTGRQGDEPEPMRKMVHEDMGVIEYLPVVGTAIDVGRAAEHFYSGEIKAGLIATGVAAVGIVPVGKLLRLGGRLLRKALQEGGEKVVKEVAQEGGQRVVKEGAQVVAREGGQAVAKEITPRLVIGRGKDLAKPGALGPGEFKLSWPPTGTVRTEWKTNSGLLRSEMRNMRPIRDASPGDMGGMYLNAERNLLRNHGWSFDPKTNLWNPPIR